MEFFLIALLLSVIGVTPIWFAKNKKLVLPYVIMAGFVYLMLGWWLLYGANPSLAGPMLGFAGFIVFVWFVVSTLISLVVIDQTFNFGISPLALLLLVFFLLCGKSCKIWRADDYSKLIGPVETKNMENWSNEILPLDPNHIRLVPRELAITVAKTTLSIDGSTIGSQYSLSTDYITLQRINNEYFYLIPLDYESFSIWTQVDDIPGYVKVSATNPYAKPEFVQKKYKYTPGAWYWENLQRRIWRKYKFKILTDYSFEEDDNGNIYWVVTVEYPSIVFDGEKVEGIILYNPVNGEEKYIPKDDITKPEYKWIDRVYPEKLIEMYVKNWGVYKNKWWNAVWTKLNLLQPETPTMNYSVDGECVIVQPITSTSNKDQAMTGLMYTNARTGISTYYTVNGGATEESVMEAVDNAVSYKKWQASDQIVYENIFGKMSSIVPILSESGKNYMGVAIVENENKRVAVGVTPREALIEYKRLITSNGGAITTDSASDIETIIGKIERIGWDMGTAGKQCYVMLAQMKKYSFVISSDIQSELALSNTGDSVKISYIKSEENPISAVSFKNITLGLIKSSNQAYVDSTNISTVQPLTK